MKRAPSKVPLVPIGWREWVALPTLGIGAIKAKVDTGARSSSLHAIEIRKLWRDGKLVVRFKIHPNQRDAQTTIVAEADVLEYRSVKSSGGHETHRPVIRTDVELMGRRWPVELTLVSRDAMGFRMLLGRQAIRGRFLVDSEHSYLAGRRVVKKEKKKRKGPRTQGSNIP